MQTIKVNEGQCLLDIAVQYCGNAALAFDIAKLNGIGVTENLIVGDSLIVPNAEIEHKKIVGVFVKHKLIPASIKELDSPLLKQGIGYWRIGLDFKLS